MLSPRQLGFFVCILYLGTIPNLFLQAQPNPRLAYNDFPDAPAPQSPIQQSDASISGTIVDPNGAIVVGAHILLTAGSQTQRTATTDGAGSFRIAALPAGSFTLTVTSKGFAPFTKHDLVIEPGESHQLPPIALQIATATTSIDVTLTQHDIAEEQIHAEEKQRVIGIFPNFFVSYNWNAAPLTSGQKFKLAFRNAIDPVAFLGAGFAGAIEQAADAYSGYGQGAAGYGKRVGASYTDAFSGTMLGGAVFPALLHQDPRYFYKGTGTTRSRIFYAISTVVICKGDNGRWQPNYSNVLGSLAGAGISNLYYPETDRHGAELTIRNALIGTASGAISALFQEFLLKKISKGVPPSSPPQPAQVQPNPHPAP